VEWSAPSPSSTDNGLEGLTKEGHVQNDSTVLVTLPEQINPAHTALVLVDIQNDFVHADGVLLRSRPAGFEDGSLVPAMLESAAELLDAARRARLLCVFVQMLGDLRYQSPVQQALGARRRLAAGRRWSEAGVAVREGTWGADFYGDLRPDGSDREIVVNKYRYSGFIGTNLDLVLRSNGIKTLVMCGDATSGCVESTTRDGFFHDYYVVTAADACADFDIARHQASLRKMDESFGYVVPAKAIIDVWTAADRMAMVADGPIPGHTEDIAR
jgi:nicotinamidase-related amidase